MKRLQTLLMTKKLPRDFQEDQVKIIPLPSSQAIRDLAERPLAGNRRNWFDQCFPVPENRDVNKMQARFQLAGVFIVEVSKATTRQPCPVEETTTTDEDPIPPNLSVGEGGGQEKSMTFSTQPNSREGMEEHQSRKILRPPRKKKL
ncbi:PROTEIN RESTRICTED TEV MOVEMENT 2 [Salix koriyanagi]|uniref:PROTEIN RESTRICTED TEV MOVEMENT 2 n=1 Tax=Salix koriyanagi TaxID=2511006 RepID=A0A9Q0WU26_9ROSI|nr:PROTEIN RESTRICTED TEV MOVEMENT 2 [Salix koriyanagi]